MRFLNHFQHKAEQRHLPGVIYPNNNSPERVSGAEGLLYHAIHDLSGGFMNQLLIHIGAAKAKTIFKQSLQTSAMLLHPFKETRSISPEPFGFYPAQIRRSQYPRAIRLYPPAPNPAYTNLIHWLRYQPEIKPGITE